MKKTVALLLACCLALSALAACGGSGGSGSTTGASTANASAAGGAPAGGVSIEFLQGKAETVGAYDAVIELFEEANPGITVEQNNVPDTYTVLTTRLSSGDYPDIFNHFPLRPDFDVIAASGQLLDMTNEPFMANVNQDILEMTRKEDGKFYALPITINTMGVYLNNDILERLGEKTPTTYQELTALLEKAKGEPDGDFLFACKDAWTLWQMMDRRLGQLFMNSGNDFAATFEKIGAGELHAKDVPEITGAAEKMLELYGYAQNDPFGTSFAQMCDDFANGKALAFFQGTWAYPNIVKANPDLNFTFIPFPADEGQTSYLSMNIDIGLCIPKDAAHVQEAKEFLNFISQSENAQVFNDIDGSLSMVNGVENSIPQFDEVFRQINEGDVYEMMSNQWPTGYNVALQDLVSAMLLSGDLDAYYDAVDKLTVEMYNQ